MAGVQAVEVVGSPGAASVFVGDGEMAARGRALDWAATPLGPVEEWPHALRAAVRLVLASPVGMSLWCGPAWTLVHNDAYRGVLGARRSDALGRSGADVWADIWREIAPMFEQVLGGGPSVSAEHVPFVVARPDGGVEQRWFDYALSPVLGDDGVPLAVLSVAADTTARVNAERALEAEKARLTALFDASPVVMAIYSGPDHVLSYVNPSWERVVGKSGMLGRPFREVFPEMAGTGIYERLRHVHETGEPYSVSELLLPLQRRPDGPVEESYWDFVWQLQPGIDGDRGPSGCGDDILVHAIEVTAHVRARQEAEMTGARDEAVLASIADAFYLLDREWRFTYVNDAAEPLLQTTRASLLGRTLWEAFPGVLGSVFEGPYREAMATGRVTSAEAYFEPLGTWFDVRSYPWSGGLMVHFRDIGARKAAEAERERLLRALEVERARLADVFHRAPSFIVVFRGPTHVYEFVNEAYYQLVGHREIIGKPLLEAIPEIRDQGFIQILDHVLATDEPWVGRESPVTLERTPGAPPEIRYLDMVFQALREADGTMSGVVVHGSDITAQVRARREVEHLLGESERARAEAEAARREAEAANRSKGEFLAIMSHELRTPLNAIGGYTELLEMGIRGPVTPQQVEDLRRVQASQRHLLGLVNEVLNYARIETGTVHYDLGDVPVAAVVASVEPLVAPQLAAKGLAFATHVADPSPVARADREKVRQVLLNLLSNAIKFTPVGGRVDVRCEVAGDAVAVAVTDTGIGIRPDELERVFEPFVQVNASLTRTHEGAGLGLAISRDLARGMGGDLVARSTPGRGSTFTLTLPRA